MFNEIKKRVDEGRWNIVGGWWIEPDLNCPLGESLIRQGLYGQLFFQKHFGKKAKVGFNPDSFGHPWTLPQILNLQELEAYCFMRPNITEKPGIPAPLFNWQGPDGSEVLAVQITGSYDYENSEDFAASIEKIRERYARDLPGINTFPFFYGVGNHGGGPTIANINKIKELSAGKYPSMHFGTLEGFVNQIKPMQNSFSTLKDELQHHARGCYSACSDIKHVEPAGGSRVVVRRKNIITCHCTVQHAGSDCKAERIVEKSVVQPVSRYNGRLGNRIGLH